MTTYPVHTLESAPEGSKASLASLRDEVGMVPNLAAAMSESPELLRAFWSARQIQHAGTFTPAEIQVLSLTNAFENGCSYCMSLHSVFAAKEGVPRPAIEALRQGESPEEPKLGALSDFSRALVRKRGHVGDEALRRLLAAGYTKAQALEVIVGIAVSTLANFAHHLIHCPVDEVFAVQRWTDPRT